MHRSSGLELLIPARQKCHVSFLELFSEAEWLRGHCLWVAVMVCIATIQQY